MKKALIIALSLAASLSAADYSGIWNGKGGTNDPKYGTIPETAQMTLLQAPATGALTGTLRIGNGPVGKLSGSVSGSTLALSIGTGFTFTLTAGGSGQLTGTYTSSTGQVGQVLFTKSK